MTAARQLTRAEIEALPPVVTLAQLAECLGVSEPTVRAALRSGELARLGIRVNRLGAQHRVITSSVLAYLGLDGGAGTVPAARDGAGQRRPTTQGLRSVGRDGAA